MVVVFKAWFVVVLLSFFDHWFSFSLARLVDFAFYVFSEVCKMVCSIIPSVTNVAVYMFPVHLSFVD